MMLQLDYKTIIATAIVGAGAVWLAKRTIKEGVEVAGDIVKKVDPVNPKNVFNDWFEAAYTSVTGSANSPGADLYDWLHQVDPYEYPAQDPADKDPRPDVWTGDIVDTREKPLSGAGGSF